MKKTKLIKIFILVFSFFACINTYSASSKYIVLLDGVNIRTGPSTSYGVKTVGSVGSTYYLKSESIVADTAQNGACDAGWYEINYNGESAYVCSTYVRVATDDNTSSPSTTCEASMQAAGFPSSYWSGLCSLQSKHPNWTFKAIQTNLEWTTAVEKESACGRSKISTSNSSFIDTSCYANEGSFRAASKQAVAFYMDPRNFLTENYIFQFEYLRYEEALANNYATAISKMLANTSFYKYHTANNVDFASLTNYAGKELNVNPISLASRMYQELGTSTSLYNLYSGLYTGYDNAYYGYYNFYNIGVSSSCVNNISYCGLSYAKSKEWNSPYAAIKGGASFLVNGYLANGQFTTYLQKFNVAPVNKNTIYINQYMTNIMAPSSESSTTYKTYSNMGLLDSAFAFYIPVYTNMGATITNSDSGATNEEPPNSNLSTSSINSIITSAGYKINGNYIGGVLPGTEAKTIKENLEAIAGNGNVLITNANGTAINSGLIGTGFKVTIKNNSETKTLVIIIKGDTSGDGIVNALDLLQVQKTILGTYKLNGAYKEAADTSNDGTINALDLLQVQKSILGTYEIKQ